MKDFFKKNRFRAEVGVSKLKNLELSDVRKFSLSYLRRLPDVMHLKELVFLTFVFSLVILILFWQRFYGLGKYYIKKEADFGGAYVEGVVGKIASFNPVYEGLNPAEDDVNKLIFSGLIKHNDRGDVVPDLAQSWEIKENGKVYEFKLKERIKWHDGVEFSASDVVYTIQAIGDPDARSPLFNIWNGVFAEEIDKSKVKITLPENYSAFLHNADFGVLPKHLFEKVPGRTLKVAEYNLRPVGTGPFRFEKIEEKKDFSQIYLSAVRDGKENIPFIDKIRIRTYPDESSLINAYAKKEIMGVSNIPIYKAEEAKKLKDINFYENQMPRYTVLFFNQKTEVMKNQDLKVGLARAVDEKEILNFFDPGKAMAASSPIPAGFSGHDKNLKGAGYDIKAAEEAFDRAGWKKEGDARKKDGKEPVLNFIAGNSDEHKKISLHIKNNWEKIGIKVELKNLDPRTLQDDYIKPRNYDILLSGVNLGWESDLYGLWHSSQKDDPGLNLSYFSNNKVDKYIEIARKTSDAKKNEEMLKKAQEMILGEVPAVFLYSPAYVYGVNREVKGVELGKIVKPSQRFENISSWYVREKRKRD